MTDSNVVGTNAKMIMMRISIAMAVGFLMSIFPFPCANWCFAWIRDSMVQSFGGFFLLFCCQNSGSQQSIGGLYRIPNVMY